MPAHAARMLGHVDGDLLDVEQRHARMMQQRFTGRRQRHAVGMPLEQRDLEHLLEIMHALADSRGRDRLALRGARQIAFLTDGDEQPEGREVDPSGDVGPGRPGH